MSLATNQAVYPSVVSRVNYGIVVKRVALIDLVTSQWNQAFIIRLPGIETRMSRSYSINCTAITNRIHRATCIRTNPMIHYLHNASKKAVDRIDTVIHYIRELVPEHIYDREDSRRVSRGLIDVGGDLLHGLFGTARDSDVAHVRHTLAELKRQNVQTMGAWKDVAGRLASLARAYNTRIGTLHNMLDTQEKAIETLFQEVSSEAVDSAKTASLLASALTRLEDFVLLLDNLERLSAGIEDLVHGILSPVLISPSILRNSLNTIDVRIRSYRTGLRVLRKTPTYYYGLHNLVATRQRDNLIIHIHIPLSDLPRHLPLYQVHAFAVPVSNANSHATLITNVPKFFIAFPSHVHCLQFDTLPEIKPSGLVYLDTTKGYVETNNSMHCIAAIMRNNNTAVRESCQFKLVTNVVKPSLFVVDHLHVILTKINVTIECHGQSTRLVNCTFVCRLVLPCRCTLRSLVGFVPPRIDDCVHHRRIQLSHHVNLALLQQFFSESQLSEISGDSLFPDPLKVKLPPLKIFQAEFAQEIEEDQHAKFDLEKLSNLTKQDKEAFASLAHGMATDWQDFRDRTFENNFSTGSWKTWLMCGTGIVAIVAFAFSVTLSYRVRALSASITLLSMLPKAHAFPVELNFYDTTTVKTWFPDNSFTMPSDIICDIVTIVLLFILVLFAIYFGYRDRRSYKFDLYLYVGSATKCRSIWVRSFHLDPTFYTFTAARYIENISIHGHLLPQMHIDWPTLKIHSPITNESYTLPISIPISWSQRNFLYSVLSDRYWCVFITHHLGRYSLLDLPSRDWHDVPTYSKTCLSHAVSISTLSPSAPSIYPQLSSVNDAAQS